MAIDPRAGTLIAPSDALDTGKLIEAFYQNKPDVSVPGQRVLDGRAEVKPPIEA